MSNPRKKPSLLIPILLLITVGLIACPPAEIDNLPKTRVILSERQRVEGSFSYCHNAAPFQCVDSSTAHLRCLLRMTQIWRHLQSIENRVIARALAPVASLGPRTCEGAGKLPNLGNLTGGVSYRLKKLYNCCRSGDGDSRGCSAPSE